MNNKNNYYYKFIGSSTNNGPKRPIPLTEEPSKQNHSTTTAEDTNKTVYETVNDIKSSSEMPNLSQEIPSLDKEKENYLNSQNVDDVSLNEA